MLGGQRTEQALAGGRVGHRRRRDHYRRQESKGIGGDVPFPSFNLLRRIDALLGFPYIEPFSSCVAVGFDVVQNEAGLHDRGRATRAAAQLGQDFPGFEGGDRAFAAGPDLRVGPVDRLLPA